MSFLLAALLWAVQATPAVDTTAAEQARVPYSLVLLDGRRLPLLEAPRWAFGRTTVTIVGGRREQLEWRQVDHEATKKANPLEAAAKPARVWTEADLAQLRGERLNVTGAQAPPLQGPAAGAQTTRASKRTAGEGEWRARAEPLRSEIANLEAQLDYLERAKDKWEAFTLGTGDYQAAAAQELGKIRRARQAAEARLKQARGSWSRLEEEARTSGALPGWLR